MRLDRALLMPDSFNFYSVKVYKCMPVLPCTKKETVPRTSEVNSVVFVTAPLFCRAKIYGIRPVVPGSANGKKDEYPGIARALSKRRTKYANEADDCQDA